jgi:hypothetical protein
MTLKDCAIRVGSVLSLLLIALSTFGCSLEVPEDQACIDLREAGLSLQKTAFVREWISGTLADPASLATSGRSEGPLLSEQVQADTVWDMLGIPRNKGMVEFYGTGVDYRNLEPSSVGAVIFGRANGYKLIFKLRPDTDIEERLLEESKKPFGDIRMHTLGPDLVLVCQVNLD